MPPAHIDAVVRLKEDVPTLELRRGDQGVVVSVWLSPGDFLCEVEFSDSGHGRPVRTLLRAGQLEVVE
jgi:hypothetical protein